MPSIKRCNAKSDKEPSPSHNECEVRKLLVYLESPGQLDLSIEKFNVQDVKFLSLRKCNNIQTN